MKLETKVKVQRAGTQRHGSHLSGKVTWTPPTERLKLFKYCLSWLRVGPGTNVEPSGEKLKTERKRERAGVMT